MALAVMPSMANFSSADFDAVYEPSDDTWLLCDALLADFDDLAARRPSLALEVGPGSGAVCNFLALTFRRRGLVCPAILACDINPEACDATLRTSAANDVASIDAITCDLLGAMRGRIDGNIDVLLWNPPYVPTPSEEVGLG